MAGVSDNSPPTIEWLNHAGFVLRSGSVALACDPWLSGSAFNRGWRPISPSTFAPEDFSSISHIWFSHQHPDHFAPNDLRRIPPNIRKSIAILYHETIDKKVIRFCQSLGFKEQIELSDGVWVQLDPCISIRSGTWFDRDSWLAIETLQGVVLNLNDCVVDSRALAKAIANQIGRLRVLLTQFSYAEYAGGPHDKEQRRESASNKLERIAKQVDVLQPQTVIPFASFIYWCHPENFHMNSEMNRVGAVADFIERNLKRQAVVLYPGERWQIGQTQDWHPSAAKYDRDLETKLESGPTETSSSVQLDALIRAAEKFLKHLHKKNPLIGLSGATSTTVMLHDLRESLELSHKGVRVVPYPGDADIEMHSESLLFCLRAPWGSNALHVNGRFTSIDGRHTRFFKFFKPADWADHGYTLSVEKLPLLLKAALFRAQAALGRKLDRSVFPNVLRKRRISLSRFQQ